MRTSEGASAPAPPRMRTADGGVVAAIRALDAGSNGNVTVNVEPTP